MKLASEGNSKKFGTLPRSLVGLVSSKKQEPHSLDSPENEEKLQVATPNIKPEEKLHGPEMLSRV